MCSEDCVKHVGVVCIPDFDIRGGGVSLDSVEFCLLTRGDEKLITECLNIFMKSLNGWSRCMCCAMK